MCLFLCMFLIFNFMNLFAVTLLFKYQDEKTRNGPSSLNSILTEVPAS